METNRSMPGQAASAGAERLSIALKAAQICGVEVDIPEQRYTFFENAEMIYGKSGETILQELEPFCALSASDYQAAVSDYFVHPNDHSVVDAAFQEIHQGRGTIYYARMKAGDTAFVWCKIAVTPILRDGVPVRMVGVVSNVDRIMRQSQEYKSKAEKDLMADILNKNNIEMQISSVLNKNPEARHLLLLVDLDDFKQINDTHGHQAGDRVLKDFAGHLKSAVGADGILGRWGGDEFLVLLTPAGGAAEMKARVASMLCRQGLGPCKITCSIGGALFPVHGMSFDDLFERADQALYQAKKVKNTFCFYVPDDGAEARA